MLKKSLGQNFLTDPNMLSLEARLAQVTDKRVLEIGGGDGRLSEKLLEQKPKNLFIVEFDHRFVSILREKFFDFEQKNTVTKVEIIEGDFLNLLGKLPEADVIVGNIPYYISSDIIFSLPNLKFNNALLMVQKEFAQKMIAKAGDKNYGRLSVTSQLAFEIKIERYVSKGLFTPRPKVDSAIILLKPTNFKMTKLQEDVVRSLFQHRNKTTKNALENSKLFSKEQLGALGAFASRRPRTLSKEECLEIAALVENPNG
ncbi:ribosomal RNA small subunit methyltransferase A [Candidatus Micrarchaeota archaeon]|nr:ribosomal RNA small subunit methyltransferase A [Candidatus Micrarchaeota archaeon]